MGDLAEEIRAVPGPILVIGASGFLGANILRTLLKHRDDAFGTTHGQNAWRLEDVSKNHVLRLDLLSSNNLRDVLTRIKPSTIFNCASYGAYSFENDVDLIHKINYNSTINLLEILREFPVRAYVHAGSSSEYGFNCAAPSEDAPPMPDSHYAVSKCGASMAVSYYGKAHKLPCVNLRLYSLYGPYEDSSRLIPSIAEKALQGTLPPFANPDASRDFVYVADAVEAFIEVAAKINEAHYGEAYNVGSGIKTTVRDVVELARKKFGIITPPVFGEVPPKKWDHKDWFANPQKIRASFGWSAATSLEDGLVATVDWWRGFLESHSFEKLSKKWEETKGAS